MPKQIKQLNYQIGLPECIIIDVDGTLALHKTRDIFDYGNCIEDSLNVPIYELIKIIQTCRKNIITIIVTGRSNQELKSSVYPNVKIMTEAWLYIHDIHYDQLYIRSAFDNRPDNIIKKEIYEKNIKNRYNVLYVIDDRKKVVEMWRELGLTVLDVAGWDE